LFLEDIGRCKYRTKIQSLDADWGVRKNEILLMNPTSDADQYIGDQ